MTEQTDEPLAALGGLPSMYESYYHALVQNFGRLPWLIAQGLLDGRRLVLPGNTPEWAQQVVRDLGVADDQIRLMDPEKILHTTDLLIPTPARMIGAPQPSCFGTFASFAGNHRNGCPQRWAANLLVA